MRRLRLLLLVWVFAGCSLMTQYDQDGQPCDKAQPDPALSCLSDAGFSCVNGSCHKATATDGGGDGGPKPDGGLDAGIDAGKLDGGKPDGGTDAGGLDAGPDSGRPDGGGKSDPDGGDGG